MTENSKLFKDSKTINNLSGANCRGSTKTFENKEMIQTIYTSR